jgi:hypothetical protein
MRNIQAGGVAIRWEPKVDNAAHASYTHLPIPEYLDADPRIAHRFFSGRPDAAPSTKYGEKYILFNKTLGRVWTLSGRLTLHMI